MSIAQSTQGTQKKQKFFLPYCWTFADEEFADGKYQVCRTVIRVYGWDTKNESMYLRIDDYPIPVWIQVDSDVEWTEQYQKDMIEFLMYKYTDTDWFKNHVDRNGNYLNNKNWLVEKCARFYKPLEVKFMESQKLYYADLKKDQKNQYQIKKFPFFKLTFANTKGIYIFSKFVQFQPIKIGDREIKCKLCCAEPSITPVLKLLATQDLPSSSWIAVYGQPIKDERFKVSSRKIEMKLRYSDLKRVPEHEAMKLPVVYPKVMSFDCEMLSHNFNKMPTYQSGKDQIFQIGFTVFDPITKQLTKILITQGDNIDESQLEVGTICHVVKNEVKLLMKFVEVVLQYDPDVLLGYNILGFDIEFMIQRAKYHSCFEEFHKLSCVDNVKIKTTRIEWSSSAYGKQVFQTIEAEGRLIIDLLPLMRRSEKLDNYKLETLCAEFLKTNKDPMNIKTMFKYFKQKDPVGIGLAGKYCVQDTYVTYLLYENRLVWFDLMESATTNGVPMFYLYTKGQQIKMYAQLLRHCYANNIIVTSEYEAKSTDRYSGAYVSEPIRGIYKLILPFDFASLYPSIMMAYNIDYSKLVTDDTIPDECCHVFKWTDHIGCGSAIGCPYDKDNKKLKPNEQYVCTSYHFRFLKQEVVGKGVIPTLLESLIAARKSTRKTIAQNDSRVKQYKELLSMDPSSNEFLQIATSIDAVFGTELATQRDKPEYIQKTIQRLVEINQVLDKRQLAYKVSANSMYGAMGVKKGYLPFLPGAMCVTSTGRLAIQKANRFLESDCNGVVIYNDTDSAYTYFPCLEGKTMKEVWAYAADVVERMKQLFPAPMKLEFEEKAYIKFLILSKKRYVAKAVNEDGVESTKLVKRGIVLNRRDNCKFLRDLYEETIKYLLDNAETLRDINPLDRKIQFIPEVSHLFVQLVDRINELFQRKYSYKDFVITKEFKKDFDEYKQESLPVHAHVAKIKSERGETVPVGTRIEYLLLDRGLVYRKDQKQNDKAEDVGYFKENMQHLRIDYLYYLQTQSLKPIEQLIDVCCKISGFMQQQFELRVIKTCVMRQIRRLFAPNIVFENEI
jgi:DNA polymerase elongation subunit (family B)